MKRRFTLTPGIVISTILYLLAPCAGAQHFTTLPKPKNVIIMIADGAGFNHYLAAEYYSGRLNAFDSFPVHLAMATYPAKTEEHGNGQQSAGDYATGYNPRAAWMDTAYVMQDCTESSAAATAMATGIKTYDGAIGMSVSLDTLVNLVQAAKATGRSAGVVTSVEFSHATPAGFVAHNRSRWDTPGIAREMLLGSRCDVIMGCGNPEFDDDGRHMDGRWNNAKYVGDSAFWSQIKAGSGSRVTFTTEGKQVTVRDVDGDGRPDPWTYVTSQEDFTRLAHGPTPKRVLGCPQVYRTLQQSRKAGITEKKDSPPFITPFTPGIPALALMANGALNVLDNNPGGFFLMIEGGAADWASEGNREGRLIEEMLDFFTAIDSVTEWVEKNSSWDETLLVVTADHETGYLWNEKIFQPVKDNGKGQLPGMMFHSRDHTNSLVPVYARGCGSELLRLFADEQDSVRGPFLQNSEVAQLVFLLWGRPASFKE